MIDWIMDSDRRMLTVLGIVAAIVFSMVIYLQKQDAKKWDAYASSHHCIAKGIKASQVGTGIGPNLSGDGGVTVVTTTTPEQTIYVCDGGEIQIR